MTLNGSALCFSFQRVWLLSQLLPYVVLYVVHTTLFFKVWHSNCKKLKKYHLTFQTFWPICSYGIFEGLSKIRFTYSNQKYSNIRAKNIRIFEPKIFEYSYSVHCSNTNIFVFVFGPKYDSEYIRIRIRAKKNIPNIFVLVFGPKKIFATLWFS